MPTVSRKKTTVTAGVKGPIRKRAMDPAPAANGTRVKEKRLQRGWSIRHLAAHSGLAISTISKIENNRMAPTVDLFARLLAALDTTPGAWFFEPTKPRSLDDNSLSIVRAADHVSVEHPSVKREVLLGGASHRDILVMRMVFPADAHGSEPELVGHTGNELIYVTRGSLEFRTRGRRAVILKEGDSLHFSSESPHRYRAHGGAACEVIMVWRKDQ